MRIDIPNCYLQYHSCWELTAGPCNEWPIHWWLNSISDNSEAACRHYANRVTRLNGSIRFLQLYGPLRARPGLGYCPIRKVQRSSKVSMKGIELVKMLLVGASQTLLFIKCFVSLCQYRLIPEKQMLRVISVHPIKTHFSPYPSSLLLAKF